MGVWGLASSVSNSLCPEKLHVTIIFLGEKPWIANVNTVGMNFLPCQMEGIDFSAVTAPALMMLDGFSMASSQR